MNLKQISKTLAAIRCLNLGNEIYLYPNPNSEYLSVLLSSLNFIYESCNSIDKDKLKCSLQVLSGLYKKVNLSSIYIYILYCIL